MVQVPLESSRRRPYAAVHVQAIRAGPGSVLPGQNTLILAQADAGYPGRWQRQWRSARLPTSGTARPRRDTAVSSRKRRLPRAVAGSLVRLPGLAWRSARLPTSGTARPRRDTAVSSRKRRLARAVLPGLACCSPRDPGTAQPRRDTSVSGRKRRLARAVLPGLACCSPRDPGTAQPRRDTAVSGRKRRLPRAVAVAGSLVRLPGLAWRAARV